MIEPISASTPSTATPKIRKGSRSSQTTGYATSANRATGQHKTNKMHQSRNFTIESPQSEDTNEEIENSGVRNQESGVRILYYSLSTCKQERIC
jgi:hypothetical protein